MRSGNGTSWNQMLTATIGTAALVTAAGCGSPGVSGGSGEASAATVADIERELTEIFESRYGEATMTCGAWHWFIGGHAAGDLTAGSALPCAYLNPANDTPVLVSAYVYLIDERTYSYWITDEFTADDAAEEPSESGQGSNNVEFLYRDGLTCEQITAPPTAETSVFSTVRSGGSAMDLGQAMYYWYDADRPAEMDPDSDGVPCDGFFPQADIDRLLDTVRTVEDPTGTDAAPGALTVRQIREAIAAEGLPPGAMQVDCTLAGPVFDGNEFLCAPRVNRTPDLMHVRVGPDGQWGIASNEDPASRAVEPTVAALQDQLDETLRWLFGDGLLSCAGTGPIGAGSAVSCWWQALRQPAENLRSRSGPVLVAVLDDDGRYVFSSRIANAFDAAAPADYPAGTTSCATLKAPPGTGSGGDPAPAYGLDYASLLHYWMAMGSPASMDDDGDGLPCETVYPAETVARVSSSPLSLSPQGAPITREQLRAHAEAVLRGATDAVMLQQPDARWSVRGGPCGGDSIVHAGDTLACTDHETEWGMRQSGGVTVVVLSDDGQYGLAHGSCCGSGPAVTDYPADATCEQLAAPPPGIDQWTDGLAYPQVVALWMQRGMGPTMDTNGNGIPCEQAYGATTAARFWDSPLVP
jgi:hypothetical protein